MKCSKRISSRHMESTQNKSKSVSFSYKKSIQYRQIQQLNEVSSSFFKSNSKSKSKSHSSKKSDILRNSSKSLLILINNDDKNTKANTKSSFFSSTDQTIEYKKKKTKVKPISTIENQYINSISLCSCKTKSIKNYFQTHSNIKLNMRTILIEYLYDLSLNFRLQLKTFFHSVYIIDQFLSKDTSNSINKTNFQLLGLSSLYISSKFNEKDYFPIENFEYASDNSVSCDEIVKFEIVILKTIEYNLCESTVYDLLMLLYKVFETSDEDVRNSERVLLKIVKSEFCLMYCNCIISEAVFRLMSKDESGDVNKYSSYSKSYVSTCSQFSENEIYVCMIQIDEDLDLTHMMRRDL